MRGLGAFIVVALPLCAASAGDEPEQPKKPGPVTEAEAWASGPTKR